MKLVGATVALISMLLVESIMMRTFTPTDSVWKNLWSLGSITRVGLLFTIVMFFSGILEIQTARVEIEEELEIMLQEDLDNARNEHKVRFEKHRSQATEAQNRALELAEQYRIHSVVPAERANLKSKQKYIDEIDGKAASGKRHHGPIATIKKRIWDQDSMTLATKNAEYKRLLSVADSVQSKCKSGEEDMENDFLTHSKNIKDNFGKGIYKRKAALGRLKGRESAIWWQSVYLMSVLVFMDMIGMVAKYTLTRKDEYYTLKSQEEIYNRKARVDEMDQAYQLEKQERLNLYNKDLNAIQLLIKKENAEFSIACSEIERSVAREVLLDELKVVSEYTGALDNMVANIKMDDREVESMTKRIVLSIADQHCQSFINGSNS